jgi:hypothetical protein
MAVPRTPPDFARSTGGEVNDARLPTAGLAQPEDSSPSWRFFPFALSFSSRALPCSSRPHLHKPHAQELAGTAATPPVTRSTSTCPPRINGRPVTTHRARPAETRANLPAALTCAGPLAAGKHAHARHAPTTPPGSPPRTPSGRASTATKAHGKTRDCRRWAACNSTSASKTPTATNSSRNTETPATGPFTHSCSLPSVHSTVTRPPSTRTPAPAALAGSAPGQTQPGLAACSDPTTESEVTE